MDSERSQPTERRRDEEPVKELVAGLEELRHKWSNAIPLIEISAGTFKVRHVWFMNVILDMDYAKRLCEQGLVKISSQLLEKIGKLEQLVTSEDWKKKMTAKEDIDLADGLLDELLAELKTKHNS